MLIGGVLLGAGMRLHLRADDYLHGSEDVQFVLRNIDGVYTQSGEHWIIMSGVLQPSPYAPWRRTRVQVRIRSLRRSLGASPT